MPTIVPLTSEAEWLSRLRSVQPWTVPLNPVLVVAPHPDDETLGSGGMVARLRLHGVPVIVVAVSDGESAYPGVRGLGEIREREQTEALTRLGVARESIHRLRLPDTELSKWEGALERSLSDLVSPGITIVAPWPRDFHPDHEACGRAAGRVARKYGLELTFYFFWAWHRGVPDMFDNLPLVSLFLTDEERRTKLFALDAHASQFNHQDCAPILSPELLRPAERDFEVYLRS
jgi:LmbE family N-acetylglucosaminyl deacetylase